MAISVISTLSIAIIGGVIALWKYANNKTEAQREIRISNLEEGHEKLVEIIRTISIDTAKTRQILESSNFITPVQCANAVSVYNSKLDKAINDTKEEIYDEITMVRGEFDAKIDKLEAAIEKKLDRKSDKSLKIMPS